jgi:hypothetical protein
MNLFLIEKCDALFDLEEYKTYRTLIRENGVYVIQNFKVQEATTYRPVDNDLNFFHIYYECEGSKATIIQMSQITFLTNISILLIQS